MKAWAFVVVVALVSLAGCHATYQKCTNASECSRYSTCCSGACVTCVSCEMFSRRGSACVCNLRECGSCLTGHVKTATGLCDEYDGRSDTCPDGHYCYMQSCQRCLDCGLYHRRPPVRAACAKRPSDCGSCLSGYEEGLVTRHPDAKPCRVAVAAARQQASPLDGKTVFVIGVLMLGSLIFAVFHARRRHAVPPPPLPLTTRTTGTSCSDEELAGVCIEETVFSYVTGEKERASTAVADPPSDDDVENVEPPRLPTPRQQDEEDTLPSTWTPSPTTGTAGSITSFAGILTRLRGSSSVGEPKENGPVCSLTSSSVVYLNSNSGNVNNNYNCNNSALASAEDNDVNDIQVGTERVRIREQ